jgi:PIN domain nuclease of toxin-antitoxin system
LTLLDAYALVALVVDEPAADEVESLLRERDCGSVVANLAEAIDISHRVHGLPLDDIREALEPLLLGGSLSVVVSDESDAWRAAELRGRHYERKTRALSLADCFLLAHAMAAGDGIATADPPLADAARVEGVALVALPDSAGRRP